MTHEVRLFIIIFGLLAVGQGFLLTSLLLAKRKNHGANLILAALISTFSIIIFYCLYIVSGVFREYPILIGTFEPIPLLQGPLWYFYSWKQTSHQKLDITRFALHFIPFICYYLFLAQYLFISDELKILFIENIHQRPYLPFLTVIFLMIVHIGVYLTLTMIHLKKYFNQIFNYYSVIENKNLHWIRMMTYFFFCILSVVAFFTLFGLFGKSIVNSIDPVVALVLSISMFTVSFKRLSQQEIFEPLIFQNPLYDSSASTIVQEGIKRLSAYKKPSISDGKKMEIVKELQNLLEREKPYLKIDLTLGDLAHSLSVSERNLTETINTVLDKSFYDLINEYRVQEFQRRLLDPKNKHFTIMAIAFDSGFNSKSTFNSIFKKYTGITPSAYKAQKISR